MWQLMTVLKVIKPIKATCTETTDNLMMASFGEQLNECNALIEKIKREIVEDPPATLAKGGAYSDRKSVV